MMTKNEHEEQSMETESALAMRRKDPGFWRELWQQLRLVLHLIRDPEVPFYLKILPFAALVYVIFPFDLITDLVPIIGQLDDVTALLVSSKVFIELAPPAVVARHMRAIRAHDGYASFVEEEGERAGRSEADEIADAIIIDTEHEVIIDENEVRL